MDDINTLTFDWQSLDDNAFLKWLLISFTSAEKNPAEQKQWVEDMSDRTEKFSNVQMDIQINGVPVPASALIRELRHHLDYLANTAARELVANVGLGELEEHLRDIESDVRNLVAERLRAAGVYIPEEEDR